MPKLTEITCRNAISGDNAVKKMGDGEGLYLWVFINGSKRWNFRYKENGKEKGLSLGVYPKVSLADARKEARRLRSSMDDGITPERVKKSLLETKIAVINRFEGVAIEWFARQTNVWSKKHCQDVERRLRVNTFPLIGEKDIADIDAPELLLMVREIESRGAYELAHRVLNVCGQVFRYGIATGRCKYNPAPDLKGALIPVKPKNQPSIKHAQLPKLMADIADYETIGDRKTQLAMLMLAHTFVRTSELIFATWNEFDLDKAIWSIPKERMKMEREHIVPLTKSVLVFLVELKRLGVSEGADFVFVGRNREKPMSTNTVLFGLYRLGYKGKMCGHGFRSVASTVLYESGLFISDVIEKQLAHEERNEVKGAYNRAEYLPARVAMMEWWSCYLDSTC